MNCLIPGGNLKVISKCLQCLAKIGDELSIDVKPDYLLFYTVNQSKTTFVLYKFKDIFFSSYDYGKIQTKDDVEINFICKVQLKAMLNIFKSLKEKKIEYCKITLEPQATKISFTFKYKHDIVIKQFLHLLDGDFTNLDYDINNHANVLTNTGSFYGHLFSNFQPTDSDLTMEVKNNKVLARNYYQASHNSLKSIRSQVSLNRSEYTTYEVGEETAITVSLKPFRAIVAFAEAFDVPVSLRFDKGGDPFIIHLAAATFVVDCALSTLDPLGQTQTTTTVLPSIPRLSMSDVNGQKNVDDPRRITQQDQEALENVDWENCEFEVPNVPAKRLKVVKNDAIGRVDERNVVTVLDVVHLRNETICDNDDDNDDYGKIYTQDSPRTKKIKYVFHRLFRGEKETDVNGEVLAPNSDSE